MKMQPHEPCISRWHNRFTPLYVGIKHTRFRMSLIGSLDAATSGMNAQSVALGNNQRQRLQQRDRRLQGHQHRVPGLRDPVQHRGPFAGRCRGNAGVYEFCPGYRHPGIGPDRDGDLRQRFLRRAAADQRIHFQCAAILYSDGRFRTELERIPGQFDWICAGWLAGDQRRRQYEFASADPDQHGAVVAGCDREMSTSPRTCRPRRRAARPATTSTEQIYDAEGNTQNLTLTWSQVPTTAGSPISATNPAVANQWDLTVAGTGASSAATGPMLVTFGSHADDGGNHHLDRCRRQRPPRALCRPTRPPAARQTIAVALNFGSGTQNLNLNLGSFRFAERRHPVLRQRLRGEFDDSGRVGAECLQLRDDPALW